MNKLIKFIRDWRNQSGYMIWLAKHSVPYLPQISLVLLLGFAESAIAVYLAVVTKNIIDSALAGGLVVNAIIVYVLLVFVNLGITVLVSLISVVLDEKFSFSIKKQIYEKII